MPAFPLLHARLQSNTSAHHLLNSCFHHTLHLVPLNPFDEEIGGAGFWEQCTEVSFYCSLLLTALLLWHRFPLGHSPFRVVPSPGDPLWVIQRMQSLWGIPPPAQSTSFQACISIHVLSNVSFHASPSFLLSFPPNIPLHIPTHVSLLSILPCLMSCMSSFHLLPPESATLPQTCLKKSVEWSSVWLKF